MPHAGPLPDITVFGEYTYLASEVAFGALAFALLYRADALRRAGYTILALYPIAFVWDWYSLHVGIFAIELRTGIELLGIPLEEHLFMVVVPALIVGFHETLHGEDGLLTDRSADDFPTDRGGAEPPSEEAPRED